MRYPTGSRVCRSWTSYHLLRPLSLQRFFFSRHCRFLSSSLRCCIPASSRSTHTLTAHSMRCF